MFLLILNWFLEVCRSALVLLPAEKLLNCHYALLYWFTTQSNNNIKIFWWKADDCQSCSIWRSSELRMLLHICPSSFHSFFPSSYLHSSSCDLGRQWAQSSPAHWPHLSFIFPQSCLSCSVRAHCTGAAWCSSMVKIEWNLYKYTSERKWWSLLLSGDTKLRWIAFFYTHTNSFSVSLLRIDMQIYICFYS